MYKLLAELRRMLGKTQAEFAELLDTDQTQISRLEAGTAGKSFHELCDRLRTYARAFPRKWLELMAAGESSELFAEYADLFFVSEDLKVPFKELWVIAALPAECQRAAVRAQVAKQIREDQARVVYWCPKESFDHLRTLAYALEDEHGLTEDQLKKQILVINTPSNFTLLPLAIIDPRDDKRLGFLSPQPKFGSGLRVVVLPQETTAHLFTELESIYRTLQRFPTWKDDNEFAWTQQSLFSLANDEQVRIQSPERHGSRVQGAKR